jgi:predicted ArsR family transcriptional regulator
MSKPREITDPRDLRALAHPVRVALVEELSMHGPLTATQAAERIGDTPANCSWHLRQLAKHGFVEEAPGGKGRQRPWKMTSVGMSWRSHKDDPAEFRAAASALSNMWFERDVAQIRRWLATDGLLPAEWSMASSQNTSAMWLTVDELQQVTDTLADLTRLHIERAENSDLRPEGARLVRFYACAFPAET